MTAGKTSVRAPDRSGWRTRVACKHADPELFFPARPGDDISAAVAICAGCPVRAECARLAEALDARFGVWAGVDRGAGVSR
ncbi:MAG: WhiB family transcriptional regulator [Streptosporangiaceae bacterium]